MSTLRDSGRSGLKGNHSSPQMGRQRYDPNITMCLTNQYIACVRHIGLDSRLSKARSCRCQIADQLGERLGTDKGTRRTLTSIQKHVWAWFLTVLCSRLLTTAGHALNKVGLVDWHNVPPTHHHGLLLSTHFFVMLTLWVRMTVSV